jgi:hypothetical protein
LPKGKRKVKKKKGKVRCVKDASKHRQHCPCPILSSWNRTTSKTICTRVQFNALNHAQGVCLRQARVFPLLDKSLKGPVYLRSSNNLLPDLVADLKGQVQVNLVGFIDSVNGRIRITFDAVPDAPVKKFMLEMQGGKKGLIVNSRNLCLSKSRATVAFKGQNGRGYRSRPVIGTKCGEKKK